MFKKFASSFSYALGWGKGETDCEFSDEDDIQDQEANDLINQIFVNITTSEDVQEEFEDITPVVSNIPILSTQDRLGTITNLTHVDGVIDGKYFFDRKNAPNVVLDLGKKVTYQAFRKSEEEEWRVTKIIYVHEEDWNDQAGDTEGSQEEGKVYEDQIINVGSASRRKILGEVRSRDGREVIVRDMHQLINEGARPRHTRFHLDAVSSEFTPMEGDYVYMYATVEISEKSVDGSGDVLEVHSLTPVRSRMIDGQVKLWDRRHRNGSIVDGSNNEIYFMKTVCDSGYVPKEGDMVSGETIECALQKGNKKYFWRATTVSPREVKQHQPVMREFKKPVPEVDPDLLENKGGVVVQETEFGSLPNTGNYLISVSVTNNGDVRRVISHKLKSDPSNLKMISPFGPKVEVGPKETVTFDFQYNKAFFGFFTEEFEIFFNGFFIVRLIKWNIDPPNIDTSTTQSTSNDKFYMSNRLQMGQKYIQVDQARQLQVPGERPFKPPSFVKTRISLYPIPDAIKKAMTSGFDGDLKFRNEARDLLKECCPELNEKLSPSIHAKRFHTLLYIAEVDGHIDICKYSKDRVSFIPRGRDGEFLALEIPGLAEGRPSLISGDSLIVSKSWESMASPKYEGCVHKVLKNEVWLKFNVNFHLSYNGEDYNVHFQLGRNCFRKCHAAIDICEKFQSNLWLYPKGVKVKPPLISFEELFDFSFPLSEDVTNSNSTSETILAEKNEDSVSNFFASFKSSPNKSNPTDLKLVQDVECMLHAKDAEKHAQNASDKSNLSNIPISQNGSLENRAEHVFDNKLKKLEWINKRLNERQKQAIRCILKGEARPLPYVIFGPPGTGKTVTLVEAVLQIYSLMNDSRILIATPSNSSANLLAERLLDSGLLQPGDMVRLVAYHVIAEGKLPVSLYEYCATIDINSSSQDNNERDDNGVRNLNSNLVMRHRITIGTCVTLGQVITLGLPRGHFTHVVVDEAGQATEPEILIPLGFMAQETGQAILAGDPHQLGPVVQSTLAASFGLSNSLLSRLLSRFPYERDPIGFPDSGGYDPRLVTRLSVNYRSLPDILELPSSLFYDSDLEPWISDTDSFEAKLVARITPLLEFPKSAIVFLGVSGSTLRDDDSPSYWNPHEVLQVVNYVSLLYRAGLTCDDIGIITPYQKQVSKIRSILESMKLDVPKVGSVEEFQGQERMVIILSTVRACGGQQVQAGGRNGLRQLLGFVNSPERVNVAISRARAFLLIIGDPNVLCVDVYWRSVVKYCHERKAYMGGSIPKGIMES